MINIAPMLAKKYDPGRVKNDPEGYYLTEKLDGNRCIAYFDAESNSWEYFSRTGKRLRVSFDMSAFSKEYIYDGEIISTEQWTNPNQRNFNTLSGRINGKYTDKSDLLYMVFDIIEDLQYKTRRSILTQMEEKVKKANTNAKILPLIMRVNKDKLDEAVQLLLKEVEDWGGEGVMINLGSATYQHKRTDQLLKVKSVYTMDMRVVGIMPGTGKYAGLVGSLECVARDEAGNVYTCNVGSGLNDCERELWTVYPEKILGEIVEVAYFSTSQDKKTDGTNFYSLRFPRYKGIREDKADTSVD